MGWDPWDEQGTEQRLLFGFAVGAPQDVTAPFHPGFAGKSPSAVFGAVAAPGGQCCIPGFGAGCGEFRHGSWAFPKIFNGMLGWEPKMPPQIPLGTWPAQVAALELWV